MNNNKGFISTFAIYTLLIVIILMLLILLGLYRSNRVNLDLLTEDLKNEFFEDNSEWFLYELNDKINEEDSNISVDNWVYYMDHYWRILGASYNGGIRMIYSGTNPPTETTKDYLTADSSGIGLTSFNISNDLEYARYRYTLGKTNGTDTYSNIHTFTSNWIDNNLKGEILSDGTCNFYRLYDSADNMDNELTVYGNTSGWFASHFILNEISVEKYTLLDLPYNFSVECYPRDTFNKEKFTLITAEEIAIVRNSGFTYLDTLDGTPYWTVSPSRYDSVTQLSYIFNSNFEESTPSEFWGVFPVISISPAGYYVGDGSWNDPYEFIRFGDYAQDW